MATQGVEFAQVSFTVEGGRRLLSDVSLSVAAGTTTALLGRSGSGKTTLLRTVNALVRPTGGRVLVGGRDVAAMTPGGPEVIALRRGIGYVIQETGLFPRMTVERNVWMALELAGKSHVELEGRAKEMLKLVGLAPESVGDVAKRYPWQLSGGQRQRVGLARALANEPEVLLMDEPFGALDPLTRAEMQDMLRELLRRVGKTTLIVTHDLEEALYLADRVVLLEAGKVVADLAAGEVRGSEIEAVKVYVKATRRTEVGPTLTDDKTVGEDGAPGDPTHDEGSVVEGAPGRTEVVQAHVPEAGHGAPGSLHEPPPGSLAGTGGGA